MGRAIISQFQSYQDAKIFLDGLKIGLQFNKEDEERFAITDDRTYNGYWSVDVD